MGEKKKCKQRVTKKWSSCKIETVWVKFAVQSDLHKNKNYKEHISTFHFGAHDVETVGNFEEELQEKMNKSEKKKKKRLFIL